jgi:hypothetical protein
VTELRLRAANLQWVETDGQIIALDETTLVYMSANESGAFLWQQLAGGVTREALVERLAATFGVDAQEAARDVDAFVSQLDARELLER